MVHHRGLEPRTH